MNKSYPIPARKIVLDPAKLAAAQSQADQIRADLAPVLVLDPAKIAEAQRQADAILAAFNRR